MPSNQSGINTGHHNYPYQVGMRVHHHVFGNGEITAIEGSGDNTKAHIHFETHGEKPLLLKYAKLTIID